MSLRGCVVALIGGDRCAMKVQKGIIGCDLRPSVSSGAGIREVPHGDLGIEEVVVVEPARVDPGCPRGERLGLYPSPLGVHLQREIVKGDGVVRVEDESRPVGSDGLGGTVVDEAMVSGHGQIALELGEAVPMRISPGCGIDGPHPGAADVSQNRGQLPVCHCKPCVERHRLLQQRDSFLLTSAVLEPDGLGVLAESGEGCRGYLLQRTIGANGH